MRLILVRHGETDVNVKHLALGRADVPLNARGRWQAQRLADALRHEPVAAVCSSPLVRALHTARPIAEAHGLVVEAEPGLIEMDIGDAEGLSYAEVRARYPELQDGWTSSDGPSRPMPGGERLLDVQARAWEAIERLRQRHNEETVVAVSHHFVILSLLTKALGMELAEFRRLHHDIAAISLLELDERSTRVVRLNDTSHLEQSG